MMPKQTSTFFPFMESPHGRNSVAEAFTPQQSPDRTGRCSTSAETAMAESDSQELPDVGRI
jgi:hypothetical protein